MDRIHHISEAYFRKDATPKVQRGDGQRDHPGHGDQSPEDRLELHEGTEEPEPTEELTYVDLPSDESGLDIAV